MTEQNNNVILEEQRKRLISEKPNDYLLGIEKRWEELSELQQKLEALDNELEIDSLSDQSGQSEEEQSLNKFIRFLSNT